MSLLVACLPAALIAYIVGVFMAVLNVIYRAAAARRAGGAFFALAWLAHLGAVVHQGFVAGGFPLDNLGEYLLVFGWAVMGLHLLLWFGWRVDVAGLLLPPIAALAAFGAWPLLHAGSEGAMAAPRGLFLFHTTVSTLGMATLCVSLAMSGVYLFQDRALKTRKQLALLERLPPLERCDRIALQALWVGFLLLSLGIGTGVAMNRSLHETLWIVSPKQTLPLLAWIVLATILGARWRMGFRGRRSAYLVITGVMLGLLTVIGMTL